MKDPIFSFLISLAVFTIIGCGFHLRSKNQTSHELCALILRSEDPYGPLWNKIYQQLHINNIAILDSKNIDINTELPTLHLFTEKQNRNTVSTFRNGMMGKYSITMSINAKITIPKRGSYPISSIVFRSFFIDSMADIAQESEKSFILNEMRQNLAEQLVRKLLLLYSRINDRTSSKTSLPVESRVNLFEDLTF